MNTKKIEENFIDKFSEVQIESRTTANALRSAGQLGKFQPGTEAVVSYKS